MLMRRLDAQQEHLKSGISHCGFAWQTEVPIHNPQSTIRNRGMTFTEVIVASTLLLIAIVPILKSLATAQAAGTTIERRTCSLALAQGKLDEIRAEAIHHYAESFEAHSLALDGSYLCNIADDEDESLRLISVSVGYDGNGDGLLGGGEVEVTLTTYVALRGSGQ
jgi:type II secretory pathway pseudopilin PulG